MKARFSSTVPNASSVAARRIYGDFGARLPLVVVVVVSDIDSLTKHPSVICRKISGVGWIGRGGKKDTPSVSRRSAPFQERAPDHRYSVGESHLGTAGATKLAARRTICETLVLAGIVFRCSPRKDHTGHLPGVGRTEYTFHAPGSRLCRVTAAGRYPSHSK